MRIQPFTLGEVATNTYVVYDYGKGNEAYLIDAPDGIAKALGFIREKGLTLTHVLLTHAHFDHVMGLGEIRKEFDALDAISAVLPAGTLSGAPKIRACQIIGELENNKRGVYGGAIGYIAFNGDMDTCIAIRIAYKKNSKVFIRSGAGIVADSVPEKEYEECINKAAAVVRALKEAEVIDHDIADR